MKVYILNNENRSVDVLHITDEYAKWCIDHNVGDEEYYEPETFNDFLTEFMRQLEYDPVYAQFAQYIVCEDGETVSFNDVYPR